MYTNTADATTKQLNYIRDMVAKRDWIGKVSDAAGYIIEEVMNRRGISTQQASTAIDALGRCRVKITGAKPISTPSTDRDAVHLQATLKKLPLVRFALERQDTGELCFFELVERRNGVRYVNRLHGAPGDYRKENLSLRYQHNVAVGFLRNIAGAIREYGEAHSRCARCHSPLTHRRSRETGLGPDCRKHYSL